MCAIIGWSGKLPVGSLFQLLYAAEPRGRDSAGLAYFDQKMGVNLTFKQAVTPTVFAKDNREKISEIQRSPQGLAHTRHASPKMPINNRNAHPFIFKSYVFAHNGAIKNWKRLVKHLKNPADEYLTSYLDNVTTDSMVLGPLIESLNFSDAAGCFGLVWMHGRNAYALRSKKELVGVTLTWSYASAPKESHKLTLIASTLGIINEALKNTDNLVVDDYAEVKLEEDCLYQFSEYGIKLLGLVPVNQQNMADAFTSAIEQRAQVIYNDDGEEPTLL